MKLDPLVGLIVSYFSSMSKHLQTCLLVCRSFWFNVKKCFQIEVGKKWVNSQSLEGCKHKLSPTGLDIVEEVQTWEAWYLVWDQQCRKLFCLFGIQFSVKQGSLTKLLPHSFWVLHCFGSAVVQIRYDVFFQIYIILAFYHLKYISLYLWDLRCF